MSISTQTDPTTSLQSGRHTSRARIELALGALTYLTTYLVMLKTTHTLNEDDYQIIRSILGTTGPLSRPLLRLLKIYQNL